MMRPGHHAPCPISPPSPLRPLKQTTPQTAAWFVSTIAFWWLLFPAILPRVQRLSDTVLVRGITYCFHLQSVLLLSLFWNLLTPIGFWGALIISTMHPMTRLPVFLMGVLAGELAVRYPAAMIKEEAVEQGGSSSYLPWPRCFLGFIPLQPPGGKGCCGGAAKPAEAAGPAALESGTGGAGLQLPPPPPPSCCGPLGQAAPRTQAAWSRMATVQSLGLFGVTLLMCAGQVALALTQGYTYTLYGAIWLQGR